MFQNFANFLETLGGKTNKIQAPCDETPGCLKRPFWNRGVGGRREEAVLALWPERRRRSNRVASFDETGNRTGPRKQKTQYIADAKTATGRLMAEIKIGPRMVDMIERSATHAPVSYTHLTLPTIYSV